MRRTRFGLLLLSAGWACFPLALVFGTLAPALVGVVLVSLATCARTPVTDLHLTRDAPRRVVAGEPFEVRVEAVDRIGAAPLFLRMDLPRGARLVESQEENHRGRATLRLTVILQDPGVVLWPGVVVRDQDGWGVWERELHLSPFAATEVLPESELLAQGREAASSAPTGDQVEDRRGFDLTPEVETYRDYMSGDRLKDVSWSHTSRLGRLISKELRRESAEPVVLLVQATRSMRLQLKDSKLATCLRMAVASAAAFQAVGRSVGLLAWSERGVEAQVRVGAGRRLMSEAMLRVGALPGALPVDHLPKIQGRPSAGPLPAEARAFLRATRAFRSASSAATPVESALAGLTRVTMQPSLVLAFLDAEETPEVATLVLQRLHRQGHRVLLVSPAAGAHHHRARDLNDDVVQDLLTWMRNREAVATAARRHGTPFVAVGPDLTDESIREVVRSAR